MRWILSHTRRHILVVLGLFGGALGNAILAAVMPIFVGRAFDAVIETPPDLRGLGVEVETGEFGAYMEVELINTGPVTLLWEDH